MQKYIVIFAALVAIAAAECTEAEFREQRPPGSPPCPRPTEECKDGTRPYQTVTVASKCCPTCFVLRNATDDGSHTGGEETPMCTMEQKAACRTKLEAKSIPACAPGEVSVPKDCCISCVPGADVLDACREKSKDDLRVAFAALPVCAADEKQEFDPTACLPNCRRAEAASADACKRDGHDEAKRCIEHAPPCFPGNMNEQQLGIQGCCATCRPGGALAIAGSAHNFRECLKAATYRECADGELPARVEGSDCPSCFIPKPKCDPECAKPNADATTVEERVGERCEYQFGGDNIAERKAVCVKPNSKRFCVEVDDEARRKELMAMSADDLAVELKSLIADYCATADAHPYCRLEALLNHVMLGLSIEEFDQTKLCFNIIMPPLGQVLSEAVRDKVRQEQADADEHGDDNDDDRAFTPSYAQEAKDREEEHEEADSPSGEVETEGSGEGPKTGGKRGVWEDAAGDYALVNAAVGSDYAKSSGFSGSASQEEASDASSLTVSTLVVCAAFVAMML